jgi:hypothetical protein
MNTDSRSLADRQTALVRALVLGAPAPSGFHAERVAAARRALLAKRCGEVARHWPALLADPSSRSAFMTWAAQRPKTMSFADGYAFACERSKTHSLPPAAAAELRAARRRRVLRRSRC